MINNTSNDIDNTLTNTTIITNETNNTVRKKCIMIL